MAEIKIEGQKPYTSNVKSNTNPLNSSSSINGTKTATYRRFLNKGKASESINVLRIDNIGDASNPNEKAINGTHIISHPIIKFRSKAFSVNV
jgi:hypothetical protein